MRIERVFAATALAVAAYAALPILATAAPVQACCSSSTQCPGDEVCRAPESLGLPACEPEHPGYCAVICIPSTN